MKSEFFFSVCPEILTLGGYSAMNTKVPHSQLFLPVAQNASPQPYEANVAGPQLLTTVSNSDEIKKKEARMNFKICKVHLKLKCLKCFLVA